MHDADVSTIVDFAREWGVLGLCQHGLPASHNPSSPSNALFATLSPNAVIHEGCHPAGVVEHSGGASTPVFREPLTTWRRLSSIARMTLDAASLLKRSQPVPVDTWTALLGSPVGIADGEELLSLVVRGWLAGGDVRVGFDWLRIPQPTFEVRSMLGAVALDIAFSVSGNALGHCSACGAPFIARRRPARNRRTYCPRCREDGAPARDAARDYWHRKGKHRRRH